MSEDNFDFEAFFSSIAAVGFGLTAYCLGAERGYVPRADAAQRTRHLLHVLLHLPQGDSQGASAGYKGFYYHFLSMSQGVRYNQHIELSSVDTGLLLMGVLTAQTYFDRSDPTEAAIRALADSMYRRVQWPFLVARPPLLCMGWDPARGYIPSDWQGYNEAMFLYVLALGSPTYPIDSTAWTAWTSTYRWHNYRQSGPHANFAPLFGHQYSHVWIDFRGIQDVYMRSRGLDYFENTRRGTIGNRNYCIDNPNRWTGYGPDFWGITASDGPADGMFQTTLGLRRFYSYRARGATLGEEVDDGTIAPTAAGGSIPFTPEYSIPMLRNLKQRYGNRLYGRFGYRDALNQTYPTSDGTVWINPDYLGIDQGPICLMAANYRDGFVWNVMRRNPYIIRGLRRAGFQGGWLDKMPSP